MKFRFFKIAKRAARLSAHRQFQMGAIVVERNRVISIGINKMRTHPRSPSKWKTIHCELDAILGVEDTLLHGSTVYVCRVTKRGEFAISKPCHDCENLLREVGIRTVCYMDQHKNFVSEAYW